MESTSPLLRSFFLKLAQEEHERIAESSSAVTQHYYYHPQYAHARPKLHGHKKRSAAKASTHLKKMKNKFKHLKVLHGRGERF